uniref:Uncharacterized protein n=1 Tax=Arundo donax TaxID=35708 RepID=A0A0A9DGY8_ARUDO
MYTMQRRSHWPVSGQGSRGELPPRVSGQHPEALQKNIDRIYEIAMEISSG